MENKTPEIENLLNAITKQAFGISREVASKKQICVICKQDATNFRDKLSRKEYSISYLCQNCQDNIWSNKFPDKE